MSISELSFSSSSKSASSATPVADIVKTMNQKKIISCIVGISKINMFSNYITKISHAAILLSDSKIGDDDDEDETEVQDDSELYGILVEYGDYIQTMDPKEEEYVNKNLVVYRYKEKGGLRYYAKKKNEFKKDFGTLCYIEMNISPDNQLTFDNFMDQISPLYENKWIKSQYSVSDCNCQHFVKSALELLKPLYTINCITNHIADTNKKEKTKNVPEIILNTLKQLKKQK
jgi:hypothetical protein